MAYDLFLFDLDDTLLDFKASEKLSFVIAMESLGIKDGLNDLFSQYQTINRGLWKLFEEAKTTKDYLKVERYRQLFHKNQIEVDPEIASTRYLDTLPETVVLVDHAEEICQWLSSRGELGIITNGIHHTQAQRIKKSKLAPYISFVSVSEASGFAKPDVRFFEFSVRMAKKFSKASSILVGDRMETDILGAHHFGIDSCWFNPTKEANALSIAAKYEVGHLSEIKKLI